jgi:FtsP/CotA-like multicopper oxidase with cupredoxin domain
MVRFPLSRWTAALAAALVGGGLTGCDSRAQPIQLGMESASIKTAQIIDPATIPKFVDQLVIPPVYAPKVIDGRKHDHDDDCDDRRHDDCDDDCDDRGDHDCDDRRDHKRDDDCRERHHRCVIHKYEISVRQFTQQILPSGYPMTTVFGYAGEVIDPKTGKKVFFENTPGATFEAVRRIPIHVTWRNELVTGHPFAVDPTIGFANPNGIAAPSPPFPPFPPGFPLAQSPVPIVTHLHGGEDAPESDGGPLSWITANGITGPGFVSNRFVYPNQQAATTLFYHDHTLGETRLNLQAGLAGFYLIRDPHDPIARLLPAGEFEIPLAIQDRTFNSDGSLFYPSVGPNPDVHPYWVPEFFGNTIMINGKLWPNLNVKQRQYRLRLVNGSNARFYNLSLSNGQSFTQIGSDGGYLPAPAVLTSLLLAPGERADLLIDFSSLPAGSQVILQNDAATPFPSGDPVDPATTGQLMRFTVVGHHPQPPRPLPSKLNSIPVLTPDSPSRTLTLNEVTGAGGPLAVLLNGQHFEAPVSELPRVGATEEWIIANLTADTHPIHLHLVQFQLASRQSLDVVRYTADWTALNGEPPLNHATIPLDVGPYLLGSPVGPDASESGWKDTVRMNPGEVTRILVRIAPTTAPPTTPGTNLFPFDPTDAPGYVWHCHIIEHEDNDMMRPYFVTP